MLQTSEYWLTPKGLEVSNDWEGDSGKFLIITFCILTEVWITHLYVYVKTQPMYYLRFVHFAIYKFYIQRGKRLAQLLNLSYSHAY